MSEAIDQTLKHVRTALEKDGRGIKPYAHQIEDMTFFENDPNSMLLWEMGTGKTGGALMILILRCMQEKRMLKTLIVTPAITIGNWQAEIKVWTPIKDENVRALMKGTGKHKADVVKKMDGPGVVVTNYEALLSADLFKAIQEWGPEVIIADEIHKCKSHRAQCSKAVAILADKAKYKIPMTGSPILNSVQDIFMPFRILDKGATFGTNIQVFMSKYMVDKNAGWKASGNMGYFPKWENNPATYEELTQRIYKKARRRLKSECLDLPPLIQKTILCEMGKEQKKAYEEMKRDLVTFIDNEKKAGTSEAVTANIALVKALRLMQIASGHVKTEKGEVIVFKENPKLKILEELLEQLTIDNKVIVGCNFIAEYEMIAKVCDSVGVKYVMLTGDESTQEKTDNIAIFQNDKNVRVVIANRGCIGVNLTAAAYSINYSRDFSLGKELQFTARNHRGGSEIHDQIVKIDLACRGTIEELTLISLLAKEDVSKKVIDIVKQGEKK